MSSCCEQLGRSEKSGGNCRCFETTTTTCEENSKGPGHNHSSGDGHPGQVSRTGGVQEEKPQSREQGGWMCRVFPTIIIPKTTLYYSFCFCAVSVYHVQFPQNFIISIKCLSSLVMGRVQRLARPPKANFSIPEFALSPKSKKSCRLEQARYPN